MARAKMNFRQWWEAVGTRNVHLVVERVGTTDGYARQLKYGCKRPSPGMAERIIEAAAFVTPGWVPDLKLMIAGVPPLNRGKDRTIKPAPAFVAAQKRAACRT